MKKSGSKVLVIVLIVMALLLIAGGVFAYVYFGTDMLKSGQELFAKYLTQNLEELSQATSIQKIDEIETQLKENKYEENITISYTEANQTKANGTTTIDIQKDPISQKMYAMISLATQEPEETLKLEYMKENNMYSLRFTNAVKQFFSVENSNLKQLATNLGLDEEIVKLIPDTIDFESLSLKKLSFTDEEKSTEVNKYSNLLYANIPSEKYAKNKDVVITLNGKTITTNSYTLTLNNQDFKNIEVILLEALKEDEILLSKLQIIQEMVQEYTEESLTDMFTQSIQEAIDKLNEETDIETEEDENVIITVYEENGNTVRIKLEHGLEYITLDTTKTENQKQIDINYTNIDEDNTQLSNGIRVIKENDNKLIVELNTVEGEEQQTTKLNVELVENENNIKLNVVLEDEEGTTEFTRNINFVTEIEYKVTLDSSNNIVLNQLSAEQIASIFSLISGKLNTEYVESLQTEHIEPFKAVLTPITTIIMYNQISGSFDTISDSSLNEAEIQSFNAKFESYEGTSVSSAYVNTLLNMVLSHNLNEANSGTNRYVTVSGDVTLAAEATAITRVEGAKYYNVECETGEDGLINNIVITERDEISIDLENISDSVNELN